MYAKGAALRMSITAKNGVFIYVKGEENQTLYYLNNQHKPEYIQVNVNNNFKEFVTNKPNSFCMEEKQIDDNIGYDNISAGMERDFKWSNVASDNNHSLAYKAAECLLLGNIYISYITYTYAGILTNIENILMLLSAKNTSLAILSNIKDIIVKAGIFVCVVLAFTAIFASNPTGLVFLVALGAGALAICAAAFARGIFVGDTALPFAKQIENQQAVSIEQWEEKDDAVLAVEIDKALLEPSTRRPWCAFLDPHIARKDRLMTQSFDNDLKFDEPGMIPRQFTPSA